MRRSWPVLLALLVLTMSGQAQALSARCSALGAACVCEEPLDTTTVTIWGGGPGHSNIPGQPWPGLQVNNQNFNPEDSVPADGKECNGKEDNGSNGLATFPLESNAGATQTAVTDAYLPAGNTVSHVLKRIGAQVGEIGMHTLAGNPGQTWCIRSYMRWDPASPIPDRGTCIDANGGVCGDHGTYFTGHICSPDANNCGNGTQTCCQFEHDQYKIHTLGFFLPTPQPHGGNIQMIASFPGSSDGTIDMGVDISSIFGSGLNVSAGANPNHIKITDCMTSWCRFETCLDYMQDGTAYARHAVTPLSTGVRSARDMGPGLTPASSIDWATGGNFNHVQIFGESLNPATPHIRYYTHAIMTNTSSGGQATRNFWPGCDPAVEGPGCDPNSGIPTPTPTVTCANNGPIVQGAGFAITATSSTFTGSTPAYTFDMDGDGVRNACGAESGTFSGSCTTINSTCTCTVASSSFAVGTKGLSCGMSDTGPTESATGLTTLTINAPPGGIPPGLNGSAKGSFQ